MKIRHITGICILIVITLMASYALVPGQKELALMNLKDKKYEAARTLYMDRLERDDLSISVVMPLTELHLQNSNVTAAIDIMEEFVQRNPDNIEARRRLGMLYQYGQRSTEYVANLEKIVQMQTSEEDLRELANTYNFNAQYEKQIEALKKLIKLKPAEKQHYVDLAYIQASQGMLAEAALTLEDLSKACPESQDSEIVEFLLSLLLDTNRPQRAFDIASQWLRENPDAVTTLQFANLMNFKKQPAFALSILEQQPVLVDKDTKLLALLIDLLVANGKSDQAMLRLINMLSVSETLPEEALAPFMELALMQGDRSLAVRIAMNNPIAGLPYWLQAKLADETIASGDRPFSGHLIEKFDPDFLQKNPVVAARLYHVIQDPTATAYWIEVAEHTASMPLDHQIDLVDLLIKMDRRSDALAQLLKIHPGPRTDPSMLSDIARLYVEMGEASRGLALFLDARAGSRSAKNDESWALVSASAGVVEPVTAWLQDRKSREVSESLLTDLFFIGEELDKPELSLLSAQRLYERRNGRRQALYVSRALIDSGDPESALEYLRTLLPGSNEEEQIYLEALTLAQRSDKSLTEEMKRYLLAKLDQLEPDDPGRHEIVYGLIDLGEYASILPITAELAQKEGGPWFHLHLETAGKAGRTQDLVQFLISELNRMDLSRDDRQERLYALLELGEKELTLPYLREFAEIYAGNWELAYEETLQKLGKRTELLTAWKNRLVRPNLSQSEKRDIAYRALEQGEKDLAETVFAEIAENAPPDSSDVAELLYLWGPRPDSNELDWMTERAGNSSEKDRSSWLRHLLTRGAADRVVELARRHLPEPGAGDPILDIYLEALIQVNDLAELKKILQREIPVEGDIEKLRSLARIATGANHTECAQAAYEKILSISQSDQESLRWLGAFAFFDSRRSQAKEYLSRYLSSSKGDCESHFYFGEILRREKQLAQAELHYFRALQLIGNEPAVSHAHQMLQAKLLMHTGSITESLNAFDRLLAERSDNNLRADLVDLLMDQGLFEEAERYLEDGLSSEEIRGRLSASDWGISAGWDEMNQ